MTFDEWFGSFDGDGMLPMAVIRMAFEAGKQSEREACAAECERMVMYPRGKQEAPAHDNVWAAAQAIRERGEKK